MKISKIQFVNRDAFIGLASSTFILPGDKARGIEDIFIDKDEDAVRVVLANGQHVLIPKSAVYITFDPDVAPVSAAKKTAKPV